MGGGRTGETGRAAWRGRVRRRPVGSRGGVAALALAVALGGCRAEEAGQHERIFGVQLHLHGSLSEGPASMRAHAAAAAELGGAVDVLWWTDHDWRIAGHTYVTGFDFEDGLVEYEPVPAPLRMAQFDGREPLPDWAGRSDVGPDAPPESVEQVRKGFVLRHVPRGETRVRMQVTEREARSGRRSLRLAVTGPPGGADRLVLGFEASRRRHIASLASHVTLRLSVLPAVLEGEGRAVLSVSLSQSRPGERARIDYVLAPADRPGDPGAGAVEVLGEGDDRIRVATIPVPTQPGTWNDWVLAPSADAERYGLGGADNSLVDLSLAIEVEPGARLDTYVDALAIERERLGPPLFEVERELARRLSTETLVQHVGQEISYAAHLNAFGADVPLVDQARHPHGLSPREAVDWAHRHGGLVSLNHYFGTAFTMISHRFPRSREAFDASVARLIEQRAYGVDLLEVGYRSRGHGLDAFLEMWDRLSAAGIRLVGIGTSDSHDAETGWTSGPNNFVTWIYARSVAEGDLLDGLRAGRAFFGDPTRFDGALDLVTADGGRMGDVLRVAPGVQHVEVRADGLRTGQTVRVLRDGAEIGRHPSVGARLRVREMVDVLAPTFVRFEVLAQDEVVAASNPIHFVPTAGE